MKHAVFLGAIVWAIIIPVVSPAYADELDDLMDYTRNGLYLSGTVGSVWDYDIRSNELGGYV